MDAVTSASPLVLFVPRDTDKEFENHVNSTGKYLFGGITLFLMDLAGSIQGVATFAFAFFTQFKNKNLTDSCKEYLPCTGKILSDPYQCFLRAINPKAEFNVFAQPGLRGEGEEELKGIFFYQAANFFLVEARTYANNNDNTMCRMSGLGFAFAAAGTRIADLFIGVIAGLVSVLFLGSCKELNGCAKLGLECTGLIRDLAWAFAIICYADVSLTLNGELPSES